VELVTSAYIKCLGYTHSIATLSLPDNITLMVELGVSLIGAIVALITAFCIKEHRL
jgi:hypothetical protein